MKCPVCRKPMKLAGDLSNPAWVCKTHRTWNDVWMRGFWAGYEAAMEDVQDSSLYKAVKEDTLGWVE